MLIALTFSQAGLNLQAHAGGDVAPAQPKIPNRKFSLADFGAVADGKASNTEAFRRAIATVKKEGGGILSCAGGRVLHRANRFFAVNSISALSVERA